MYLYNEEKMKSAKEEKKKKKNRKVQRNENQVQSRGKVRPVAHNISQK